MRLLRFYQLFSMVFLSLMISLFLLLSKLGKNEAERVGGGRAYVEEEVNKIEPLLLQDTRTKQFLTTLDPNTKWLREIDNEMSERRRVMAKACHRHKLDLTNYEDPLHQPKGWEYLISKPHRLIWCNVFKSASSSWMYVFNRLAGYSRQFLLKSRTPLVTLARKKYSRPSGKELVEEMKTSLSFLVGRNPFERLVSGYRDKILKAFIGSDHCKMKRKIVVKYRGIKPTDYVPGKTQPTFEEFVKFILDERDDMDMHWAPVYSFCNPCQVNFTAIVKFETLDRDQEYIMQKSGIGRILGKERREKFNVNKDGKKSSNYVVKYFSELSPEDYGRVSDLYRVDFDIFGYRIPTYEEIQANFTMIN